MKTLAVIGLVALAAITFGQRLEKSIGGKSVDKYHESVYDPRVGVYLYSGGDCDGAHRRLVLSADHISIMKNEGILYDGLEKWDRDDRIKDFKKEVKPGRVSAKTNRGIRLGMTEAQVRAILGKPAKQMWSKKFGAHELIYRREVVWTKHKQKDEQAEGIGWANYYLFRNGKLYYIELTQDYIGGAC